MNYQVYVWVVLSVLVVILGGALIYVSLTAEKIILQKNDWRCTETEKVTHITYITSDNALIPVSVDRIECVNYARSK